MSFTLTLTALAMAGGIVFGTLLAMMRLSSIKPVSMFAGAYVNLMRSIPLVLVIFWFFFLVPYIGAWILREPNPIRVGAFWSAAITFTLFEAAYYCEIMRAGIQSIPRGQVWSGYALGLDYWQTMARIVLPQAFRNMLPVLLTQTIILFQDTSLVYVISATDFLAPPQKSRTATTAWSRCTVSWPWCISSSRTGCPPGEAAPGSHRNRQVGSHDLDQEREQVVRRLPGPHQLFYRSEKRRSRGRVRAVWERKIDADQMRERPGAVPEGRNHGRRHLGRRPEDGSPKLRSRIGMVFQNFELFPHMTVMRNLTLAQVKVLGRGPDEAMQKGAKAARTRGPRRPQGQVPRPALPGASSSASRSPARSPWTRSRCCSTSRLPRSTRDDQRSARREWSSSPAKA